MQGYETYIWKWWKLIENNRSKLQNYQEEIEPIPVKFKLRGININLKWKQQAIHFAN